MLFRAVSLVIAPVRDGPPCNGKANHLPFQTQVASLLVEWLFSDTTLPCQLPARAFTMSILAQGLNRPASCAFPKPRTSGKARRPIYSISPMGGSTQMWLLITTSAELTRSLRRRGERCSS